MNKDIIAITTYCDTKEKIDVLIENLNLIREKYMGFDIAIHANYPLPEYIQRMTDSYFYKDLNYFTKEKKIELWFTNYLFNKKFSYDIGDYGFSVLSMIKSLAKVLYDYDRVLLINYDVMMNDIYFNDYYTNYEYDLLSYTFYSPFYFTPDYITLNLMNFNPKKFTDNISKFINYDNYFSNDKIVEQIFFEIIKKSNINYKILSGESIVDKINYSNYNVAYKNDFFNNNYVIHKEKLLEIYLWNLSQKIEILKLNIDENEYVLKNKNDNLKDVFESYLQYNKQINNITIMVIDNDIVNIPLKILDSENASITLL